MLLRYYSFNCFVFVIVLLGLCYYGCLVDVWVLGCMLYCMVFGCYLFVGDIIYLFIYDEVKIICISFGIYLYFYFCFFYGLLL